MSGEHIMHVMLLFVWVSLASLILKSKEVQKKVTIGFGVVSLAIVLTGLGMVMRMGYAISSPWVLTKLGVWLALSAAVPMVAKRLPAKKGMLYNVMLVGVLLAVTAVYVKW